MRLLNRYLLVAAALVLLVPATSPAQGDWRDERAAERAERVRARAEERAQRQQERVERRLERQYDTDNGAHILFGQSYDLPEGSTTSESVVVVGGDATINGHAEDDVLVVGGTVKLGPKAVVDGDVSVVGGQLDRDPLAQVAGDVHVAHVSVPWAWAGWTWPIPNVGRFWWEGAALAFTIGRFVLVLILSMLVVTIAPRWTGVIAARLTSGPGVSALVGFAAEIFFAPALIILAIALIITIVGIPLIAGLPFLVAAFALTWVAGYAVVAALLGARLRGSDWYVNGLHPFDVLLGSCLLSGITLFGQALMMGPGWMAPFAIFVRGTGWTIEYIAWTVGLGAALVAWARSGGFDTGTLPPVVPPLPTPSPTPM